MAFTLPLMPVLHYTHTPKYTHLQHVNLHAGLAISSCGEDLGLGGGQGGVAGDELGGYTTQCL